MSSLSDTEVRIIFMLRKLRLFDKVEFKYSKRGELQWQVTATDRGIYDNFDGLTDPN